MDLELTGRGAVVTGGSRGIGAAIAAALRAEGANVVIVARNPGPDGIAADTGDDASVANMANAARAQLGAVDILVNVAATPNQGAIPEDALEAEINVKVRGYLRCARAFAPGMVERGWGRIINVGGTAGIRTGSVVGSVRNAAVTALSRNLADELGPHGVGVTAVHPGITLTDRVAARDDLDQFAASTSIGRIVTPEEVANVVAFLASPKGIALNGDSLVVCGGMRGAIRY